MSDRNKTHLDYYRAQAEAAKYGALAGRLEKENKRLRAALEALPEWADEGCLWCDGLEPASLEGWSEWVQKGLRKSGVVGHAPNCLRQRALGLAGEEKGE